MKKILFLITGVLLLASSIAFAQSGNSEKMQKELITDNKVLPKEEQDSILMQKLSSEQLMEIKKQELEVEKQKIEAQSKEEMPFTGPQLIFVILLPFFFILLLIYIISYYSNVESRRRHEIHIKSLELGQILPENFFDEPKKRQQNASNLKRGIILIAVGLALVVCYFVMGLKIFMIGGIIPAFIGVGYLLVHFLEKPKSTLTNEQQNG